MSSFIFVSLLLLNVLYQLNGCRPPALLKEDRIAENTNSYSADVKELLRQKAAIDSSQILKISFYKVNEAHPFRLENGIISLSHGQLDREQMCPESNSLIKKMCDNECCKILRLEVETVGPKLDEYCVKIIIEDENDNAPTFPHVSQKYVSISEAADLNEVIQLPIAKDNDSPIYNIDRYEIKNATPLIGFNKHFVLEDAEGLHLAPKLKLIKKLDREEIDNFAFILTAYDKGNPPKTGTVSILLKVVDVNDVTPRIANITPGIIIKVNESYGNYNYPPNKHSIATFEVEDFDADDNGRVHCKILSFPDTSYRAENFFEVKQPQQNGHNYRKGITSWVIESRSSLDYEVRSDYKFILVASDYGKPSLSSTQSLSVILDNIDDNPIHISFWAAGKQREGIEVEENALPGVKIARVEVKDSDLESTKQLERLKCSLGNHDDLFTLSPQLLKPYGIVKEFNLETKVSFDREERSEYKIQLLCTDNQIGSTTTTKAELKLNIRDTNDCYPKFRHAVYRGTVNENSPKGSTVLIENGKIRADDCDEYPNNQVNYKIVGKDSKVFRINSGGDLTLMESVDYEKKNRYNFTVVGYNNAPHENMQSNVSVIVDIIDVNDNPVHIVNYDRGYTFSVDEEKNYISVGFINASDADTLEKNKKIKFTLHDDISHYGHNRQRHRASQYFDIKQDTGEIRVKNKIDREEVDQFTFKVTATNPYKLEIPRVSYYDDKTITESTTVYITVNDINDNKPKLCRTTQNIQSSKECISPPAEILIEFKDNIYYGQEITSNLCTVFEYDIQDRDKGEPKYDITLHSITEREGAKDTPITKEYFVFKNEHVFCIKYLPRKNTLKQVYTLTMTIAEKEKPAHKSDYICKVSITRTNTQSQPLSNGNGNSYSNGNKPYSNNAGSVDRQSFVMIVIFVTIAVLCIVLFLAVFLFFYMKKCDTPIEKDYTEGVAVQLHGHGSKGGSIDNNIKPENCTLLYKGRQTEIDGDAMYECHAETGDLNLDMARRRYETWCEKNRRVGGGTMPHTPKTMRPVVTYSKQPASGTLSRKLGGHKSSSLDDLSPNPDVTIIDKNGYQTIDPFSILHEANCVNLPYTSLKDKGQSGHHGTLKTSTEPLYSPKKSLKSTYFETSFV